MSAMRLPAAGERAVSPLDRTVSVLVDLNFCDVAWNSSALVLVLVLGRSRDEFKPAVQSDYIDNMNIRA